MRPSIYNILKEYWGYDSYRPLQEEIINAVLDGKDTLALLPTGGGKSICFQVPAMAMPGLCLVVSPLIALMKDQVENLRKKGITSFAIYSGMDRKNVINILKLASSGNCKFLYVSPERLETKLFLEYLPALDINLVAIDEAHCISQWGYDFRPTYLRIAALREQKAGIPLLALTASATPQVQVDICEKLLFGQHTIFRQSFERPNLSYSVFQVESKLLKLVEILTKVPGSSIVYCKSRRRTKQVAEQLASYGIEADFYHAGLVADDRNRKQDNWIKNKIRTIVSTNAFGMGIDKSDVKTVVHLDPPDCLENYYQEAGRAGRNNRKAYAVLLYQEKDLTGLEEQVNLRFPPLKDLRSVYQAVVNYLQMPSGTGEGNYYDFDLGDFLSRFKLPSLLVVNALKVLEQENFLSFNEQAFLPSLVIFTCNKESLYAFESANPQVEPIIKALLRSYEGIFDVECAIQEKALASFLQMDLNELTAGLHQLHRFGIISYSPKKDEPQLFFIQNRLRVEELTIDMEKYLKRKHHYKMRIENFISYIKIKTCRSVFTGRYFGDATMKACGICDNCIRQKRSPVTAAEFSTIEERIMSALDLQAVNVKNLMQHLHGIRQEKAWKVIEFLQAEKKILVNESGMIRKA
ncbi:MAG: ATP-dependent DNA helicase RecQ [Chitinophagaceae bacterium]